MYDIISLGELLIDFTPRGLSERGNYLFEANPGGAPCNVLAAAAALGKKTAFIGKVGEDTFGSFLKDTISSLGIGTQSLYKTPDCFTTLAFVTLDSEGNRNFAFSRNGSADTMLSPDEISDSTVKDTSVFHVGTLSLTDEPSRSATLKALDCARANGVVISVDPNLREPLWKNAEDAKTAIRTVLSYADIIKISDYELAFLYGTSDVRTGMEKCFEEFSPKILFATCGKDGAYVMCNGITVHHPCYLKVKTVDTTGAGDSFCGASLSALIDAGLDFESLGENELYEIIRFASAAASITTSRYGAISVMPNRQEIEELIRAGL